MFAEIIPQIRTIPSLGIFDYEIPKNIDVKIGDVVKIEFKKTVKIGLVYKIKKTCRFKKVKPIISKVFVGDENNQKKLNLSETQVELIAWLSKEYKISPALAFKSVMPEIPQKKRKTESSVNAHLKSELQQDRQNILVDKNRIKEIKKVIDEIITEKKSKENINNENNKFLLHYNNKNEKNAVLFGLNKKFTQTLIIVPEKKDVLELEKIFHKNNPILIYSGLAKNKQWQAWQNIKYFKNEKIKNNYQKNYKENQLIIGTKNAVFIPPDNLDLIIIDNEEDKSHENYDQNPKYCVLNVVNKIIDFTKKNNYQKIKKYKNIKLLLTSQAPLVSNYFKFKNINLLNEKIKKNKKSLEIVNMEDEKKGDNYSYFSNKLIDKINEHNKTLLIFNRKGEAKLLLCKSCQEILPLSKTINCPNCQSLNLKKIIFGTTKLKNDLQKIFPNKKIIELTKDIKFEKEKVVADIIIGTDYALNKINLDIIDFIGIISVDHQLAIPHYLASERVFQMIVKIINLKKDTLLQTHSPENIVIQTAIHSDYQTFYNYELKIRKNLNYPPFDNEKNN